MTVSLMVTNVTMRQPSMTAKVRLSSMLDSYNRLSIRANQDKTLSHWVDIMVAKQESTAFK
jgi:hypothetical protein